MPPNIIFKCIAQFLYDRECLGPYYITRNLQINDRMCQHVKKFRTQHNIASQPVTCFFIRGICIARNCIIIQVFLVFLSVWVCDSAAFIVGTKIGKKKIAPLISPNKTWEGTIAGYIFSVLFIYFLVTSELLNINDYTFTIYDILIMGSIVGVIGQLGDLFESMIKRKFNVKDSGTLLQGHGGVLDRFDSLLFVIPAFYVYIKIII